MSEENKDLNRDIAVYRKSIASEITIYLDSEIDESSRFQNAIEHIRNASENDVINVVIDSPGGYVHVMNHLINTLIMTPATTRATVCHAASAAAITALACDQLVPMSYCTMMIHNAHMGAYGSPQNIVADASKFMETFNDMCKTIYKGFLTEKEYADMLLGKEIWLNDLDIVSRLKTWVPLRKRKALEAAKEVKKEAKKESKKESKATKSCIKESHAKSNERKLR